MLNFWNVGKLRRACNEVLKEKGLDGALWFDKKRGKEYCAVFWVPSVERLFAMQVDNTHIRKIAIQVGEYQHT